MNTLHYLDEMLALHPSPTAINNRTLTPITVGVFAVVIVISVAVAFVFLVRLLSKQEISR